MREARHFVQQIIEADLESGKYGGRVVTRFPPEPNGYLHIGHAKAICADFGMAQRYGGICHLRFDDTNPEAEDVEYVESIKEDVRWLGFDWGQHLYFASDYFDRMYQYAEQLILKDKAYVCTLTPEEFKACRGAPTRPGRESPWRRRSPAESLDLFRRMRAGEFPDGGGVLRAKIDMASPNLHLRDPALYRVKRASHHRTGDKWCIYPTYDFAHCLEDSIERVTHSMCTLEFEVHRPLYDWILDQLGIYHPQQIEFARLNLSYTVLSKRRLLKLVEDGHVNGWDDPRMPTLCGLRRRGYTPESIRQFCDRVGLTKFESLSDVSLLEHCVREDLNRRAERRLAVLRPLRLVIDNYPEDRVEYFEALNNPEDPAGGTRRVPFSRVLYVDRDDFDPDPPKGFYRLAPGREVRLRSAYYVTCTAVVADPATGQPRELRCTCDPESRGGSSPDKRRVTGTIHWVSAAHAVPAEVRLYDRLFAVEDPRADKDRDFREFLNPASLEVLEARVEPALAAARPGQRFQFERIGYFCVDPDSEAAGRPVFNRTVALRDSWARRRNRAG